MSGTCRLRRVSLIVPVVLSLELLPGCGEQPGSATAPAPAAGAAPAPAENPAAPKPKGKLGEGSNAAADSTLAK